MKYTFDVHEENFGVITVEAASEEDAEELAFDAYCDGEVNWLNTDYGVSMVT